MTDEENKSEYDFVIRMDSPYACKVDSEDNISCIPVLRELVFCKGEDDESE